MNSKIKNTILLTILTFIFILGIGSVASSNSIYSTGSTLSGIRDYREVMPGILYRGGSNNGRKPLNSSQLKTLCENGIGSSIYLYNSGFAGPSTTTCSEGSMSYQYIGWQGQSLRNVHKLIFNSIRANKKPVFIHCWYGIHATGFVAATALMQFCEVSAAQAIAYWKVGIAAKLQYPAVIESIRNFNPDSQLQLSGEEQRKYCPNL